MVRKADAIELRRLLTAIMKLHSWQGDLLGHAADILGAEPTQKADKPTPPRRPKPASKRSHRRQK